MYCPYCQNKSSTVIDSRESEDAVFIRRRRECLKCAKRFTTYERIETNLKVLKKDGRKEDFNRDKLVTGMVRSCKKRPITVEHLNKIADRIEAKLRSKEKAIVETEIVGNLIMTELKKLDSVAYIRFASVYRDFAEPEAFALEAQKLNRKLTVKL